MAPQNGFPPTPLLDHARCFMTERFIEQPEDWNDEDNDEPTDLEDEPAEAEPQVIEKLEIPTEIDYELWEKQCDLIPQPKPPEIPRYDV